MGNEYIHVIVNLFAVLIIMFGLLYVYKKVRTAKFVGKKHINIVNIVPVGTKEKIILMEVNNTVLLVGATPNHIRTLYVFDEIESIKPGTESQAVKGETFAEAMKSLTN